MDILKFLDQSAYTDSLSRFDLVQKAIHEGIKWNKFRGKTSFRAKVLTMPIRLAGVDTTPLVGEAAGGQVAKKGNKIAFKGRILGDPSPHDWLIDPCDLDAATDPGLALRMTALHTTFESANDIVVSEATMPKMGDIVNIELTPNVFWYNLSFGKFTSIANQAAPGSEGPAESAGAACDSLESFFENINYDALEGGGATFSYQVGRAGEEVHYPSSGAPSTPPTPRTPTPRTRKKIIQDQVLSINKSKVWPWSDSMPGKTITLVVFYHGSGYGDQDFAINHEEYGLKRAFTELNKTLTNTLFIIPRGPDANWQTVKKDIERLKSENSITIDKYILGGWSAGSRGSTKAIEQTDISWDFKIWADPSPESPVMKKWQDSSRSSNYDNMVMYYNKENWGGKRWYETRIADLVKAVEDRSGTTHVTSLSNCGPGPQPCHSIVLKNVFKNIGGRVN
jgi:hypothetical protein